MRVFESKLLRGLVALAALAAAAVSGYVTIEGWSLLDAAYMTVLTFTTVGYDEVHPLSPAGRVFTMVMMVAGAAVMLYILSLVMQLVVAQEVVHGLIRRHRMRSRMAALSGHFIVCGYGRVGRAVAEALAEGPAGLVIVDRDEEAAADAEACGLLCVRGDSTADAVLAEAQVGSAAGLVAATGSDSQNVYIALSARSMSPGLRIVARASGPDADGKLRRAGADEVFIPHAIGGRRMALSVMETSG